MKFLTGVELYNSVKMIASGSNPSFAVAFWGSGSNELVSDITKNAKIICNLAMGGTNPFVIEEIMKAGVTVRQNDILHAKVYMNETSVVVSSSNASANGLGLEGNEQKTWEEAGVFSDNPEIIAQTKHWFSRIWESSKEISDEDLKLAKIKWKARQSRKPSLRSFADFNFDPSNFPLITWGVGEDYNTNPKHKVGKTKAAIDALEKEIEEGVDIEGPEDREALSEGRWVIYFDTTKNDNISRTGFSWVCCGKILEDAFKYKGAKEFTTAVRADFSAKTEPFAITKEFKDAFIKVISDDKFEQLRTDDYDGAWFTAERLELTKIFWKTLHREYMDNLLQTGKAA